RTDGKTYHHFLDECYQQMKAVNDWPTPTSSFCTWMRNHFAVNIPTPRAYEYLQAQLQKDALYSDALCGYRDGRALQSIVSASDLNSNQLSLLYAECMRRYQRNYSNGNREKYQEGLEKGHTYQAPIAEILETLLASDVSLPGLATLQDHANHERQFSF